MYIGKKLKHILRKNYLQCLKKNHHFKYIDILPEQKYHYVLFYFIFVFFTKCHIRHRRATQGGELQLEC